MTKKHMPVLLLFLALGLTLQPAQAVGGTKQKKKVPEAPPTLEVVAQFLEGYAKEKAQDQGGWMIVPDTKTNEELKLRLIKIHRERLSKTADKTYFVCADFESSEGKRYDLDFWVQGDGSKLTVSDITIHKVNGAPRYIWAEHDGVWVQLSV
jgi:hypothetical protein